MSRKTIIIPKARRARTGSPWIFANEIRMDQAKALAPGSLVNVRGEDGREIGTGFFNPKSLIAVRLLSDSAATRRSTPIFLRSASAGRWRCATPFMTSLSIGWYMPKATDCRAW